MIVTLGTLVLTSLLAVIASPPAEAPSAAPAPTMSPVDAPSPNDDLIRRGPASAPRLNGPHANAGDVTIVNSGSTNTAGYTIVVHPDRSADVTVAGSSERKTVGEPQARWLFAKVHTAVPLGALPGGSCMKSVSFGSATTIAYDGQRTPDLACGGDATTRELMRTANVIVEQLHVPERRPRGIQLR